MRWKIIKPISFCLLIILLSGHNASAWFGQEKPLASINGQDLTADDFRHWWQNWKEKETPFPETPDSFIEWNLMVNQAKERELYNLPSYQRKLKIFLSVRNMMLLKNEEIDSKIKISAQDIKDFYQENYTPIWRIQALTYNNQTDAMKAFNEMQQYNGSPAGHLPFTDQKGILPENGGPISFEQIQVLPESLSSKKNKKNWLSVLRKLKPGYVAEPFEDDGKFIFLRLHEQLIPPDDDFAEKQKLCQHELVKKATNDLSQKLIERLEKKYNVQIDEDLLAKIDPKARNYSSEFLDKKVVTMTENETGITVDDMIRVISNDWTYQNRYGIDKTINLEELKKTILFNAVYDTLISLESMNRHYEKNPPLKWIYEFYQGNRLKAELESSLLSQVQISNEEIDQYYQANKAQYSMPTVINYAMLTGEENLVSKVWASIIQGGDFFDLAKKYYSEDLEIKQEPLEKLPENLQLEFKKLVKGEVSPPFVHNAGYAMVKMINQIQGRSLPLEKVSTEISKKIKKGKSDIIKKEYIDKLKTIANISINQEIWQKIREEFGVKVNEK
ncbi:MAG: peptidyl-prolyl cis-trans isomerase [Proteobacteria bacterium]|nr:peptidyl-prolyl cis-trans isomerase [Pseudomonadota bacterium]MBU1716886.1 peptidyl-prolyl cis-trans isomerase [Pseudomonadota bacterium]